jgi:hypothetical protein
MSQGICGRPAALVTLCLFGLFPPAFATDRQAGGIDEMPPAPGGFNPDWGLEARPCPTRFDYLVLASFADASDVLSLSTYNFRSAAGLSGIALAGWQRVDFGVVKPPGENFRSRHLFPGP